MADSPSTLEQVGIVAPLGLGENTKLMENTQASAASKKTNPAVRSAIDRYVAKNKDIILAKQRIYARKKREDILKQKQELLELREKMKTLDVSNVGQDTKK